MTKKIKIKIPPRLVLLGEEYEVKIITQEEMNKIDSSKDDTWGKLLPSKKLILVVNNENSYETFLHELGHYFNQYYGLEDNETSAEAFAQFIISINKQTGLI